LKRIKQPRRRRFLLYLPTNYFREPKKLGRNLREVFKHAMAGALRTGRVVEVTNRINSEVIVKAQKQNDVVVRKIADRDFYLIPPNEIK
jgi:hypothetical protein